MRSNLPRSNNFALWLPSLTQNLRSEADVSESGRNASLFSSSPTSRSDLAGERRGLQRFCECKGLGCWLGFEPHSLLLPEAQHVSSSHVRRSTLIAPHVLKLSFTELQFWTSSSPYPHSMISHRCTPFITASFSRCWFWSRDLNLPSRTVEIFQTG